MVLKNLLRRKGRTLLTVLGISIGVATIVALGSLADGLQAGYGAVIGGSQADLVLSDPEAFDIIMSSLDEDIGEQLDAMPEVEDTSSLLQGLVTTESLPYFFVFGYPADSFVLDRYNVVAGVRLDSAEAGQARGRPIMLGSQAAEAMGKEVGDSVRLGDSSYRVVGIYETGDAFEESGAVVLLPDAQDLLGMPRQVSLFYIKLSEPSLQGRLETRVERVLPDLSLTTTNDLADNNLMADSVRAMVWGIAALAIIIGGVSMMNAQLMAVIERTREIGVLRAVGWHSRRVLFLILSESMIVGILGGVIGLLLSWLTLLSLQDVLSAFGASPRLSAGQLSQAFIVVVLLGVFGGAYPAWRASKLQPIEALRYEGGSTGKNSGKLPLGGMPLQNLWRRKSRTAMTLGVIALTVGSVVAMAALVSGMLDLMQSITGGGEIMIRQRDAADSGLAFIDERIADRLDAMPEVQDASGFLVTAIVSEEAGIFVIQGFNPRESGIEQFQVVEGERIFTNRQIMVGRAIAEANGYEVGENIDLGGIRYRVVGIYETGQAWSEMGGVITLRDAQSFAGRPGKVTFISVDLADPSYAQAVVDRVNAENPEVAASLAGEFVETLPDAQNMTVMTDAIVFLAILVGGIGMMNTMLMAVLERTREIGVLRALGWRRRDIIGLIMKEALWLAAIGGVLGIIVAVLMGAGMGAIPQYGEILVMNWDPSTLSRGVVVIILLAIVGGLYPALRATQLQPIEALRYE